MILLVSLFYIFRFSSNNLKVDLLKKPKPHTQTNHQTKTKQTNQTHTKKLKDFMGNIFKRCCQTTFLQGQAAVIVYRSQLPTRWYFIFALPIFLGCSSAVWAPGLHLQKCPCPHRHIDTVLQHLLTHVSFVYIAVVCTPCKYKTGSCLWNPQYLIYLNH